MISLGDKQHDRQEEKRKRQKNWDEQIPNNKCFDGFRCFAHVPRPVNYSYKKKLAAKLLARQEKYM